MKRQAHSLDRRTLDALRWAEHCSGLVLKDRASASVIVRRAVALYVAELERSLAAGDDRALTSEKSALRWAARGNDEPLPEEQLIAVPPRMFSTITAEASAARSAALREENRRFFSKPFDPEEHA